MPRLITNESLISLCQLYGLGYIDEAEFHRTYWKFVERIDQRRRLN